MIDNQLSIHKQQNIHQHTDHSSKQCTWATLAYQDANLKASALWCITFYKYVLHDSFIIFVDITLAACTRFLLNTIKTYIT